MSLSWAAHIKIAPSSSNMAAIWQSCEHTMNCTASIGSNENEIPPDLSCSGTSVRSPSAVQLNPSWELDRWLSIDHCLGALRQGAMCKAYLTIGSFYWWPKNEVEKERVRPPHFKRKCVKWEILERFLEPGQMDFVNGVPEAPLDMDWNPIVVPPTDDILWMMRLWRELRGKLSWRESKLRLIQALLVRDRDAFRLGMFYILLIWKYRKPRIRRTYYSMRLFSLTSSISNYFISSP